MLRVTRWHRGHTQQIFLLEGWAEAWPSLGPGAKGLPDLRGVYSSCILFFWTCICCPRQGKREVIRPSLILQRLWEALQCRRAVFERMTW